MEKKFKSWAFTVRPKNGIKPEQIKAFEEFINKKDGGFAVLEGESDSLHMHAGVFLKKETTKSNFNLQLQRIYERVRDDEDSIKVLRGGTRIMYNLDFWNEYCQKESNPRILIDNIPNDPDEFFPSEEEQQAAKLKSIDSVMAQYELLIREREPELKPDHLEFALYDIWFKDKLMKAPREKRKKRELQEDLKKWMWPEEFSPDW